MIATLNIDGYTVPLNMPVAAIAAVVKLSDDRLSATVVVAQRTKGEVSGAATLRRFKKDLNVTTYADKIQVVSAAPDLVRHQAADDAYAEPILLKRKTVFEPWTNNQPGVVAEGGSSPGSTPVARLASVDLKRIMDSLKI